MLFILAEINHAQSPAVPVLACHPHTVGTSPPVTSTSLERVRVVLLRCLAGVGKHRPCGSIPREASGVNLALLHPRPLWSPIFLPLSPQSIQGSWTPPAPTPRLASERICRPLLFEDRQETTGNPRWRQLGSGLCGTAQPRRWAPPKRRMLGGLVPHWGGRGGHPRACALVASSARQG